MAVALIHDDVDLMACGVCFHRYDLKDKKPKFLQCSHSLCLPCAKEILKGSFIRCPFCRFTMFSENADSLPNNNYATQILLLMEKEKKTEESDATLRKFASMSWCSVCQSAENLLCEALGHSTITMTSEMVKNMEHVIQMRTEVKKLKDQGLDTLAQIIQERRQIEEHLSLVMKSIHFAEEEVKRLQDDNNLKLSKAISILDSTKQPVSANTSLVSQQEENDLIISELTSMIEDFNPNDTIDILIRKMKKVLGVYTEYLKEAKSTSACYDLLDKTKVTVALDNDTAKTPLVLNLVKKNESEQDVTLLSHSILSVLDRKNLLPTTCTFKMSKPIKNAVENVIKSEIPSKSFVLGQSIFILKIHNFDVTSEIWIQPCLSFNNEFLQKLGAYCYKSPKPLKSLFKAVHDVYVLVYGVHQGTNTFHNSNPFPNSKSLDVNEVGIYVFEYSFNQAFHGGNSEIEWNMIFPLKNYKDARFEMHVKDYKIYKRFGKLIYGNTKALATLGSIPNTERRNVTFTLESI